MSQTQQGHQDAEDAIGALKQIIDEGSATADALEASNQRLVSRVAALEEVSGVQTNAVKELQQEVGAVGDMVAIMEDEEDDEEVFVSSSPGTPTSHNSPANQSINVSDNDSKRAQAVASLPQAGVTSNRPAYLTIVRARLTPVERIQS